MIANTPEPPYYAVLFTTERSDDQEGYTAMAEQMSRLAESQPGYLGMESAYDSIGITISYWKDLEAIAQWKNNAEHIVARELGRTKWYKSFKLRIAKVERDYGFNL